MATPKPKEPAEPVQSGSWFNWWPGPGPVITSGTVLGAALLCAVGLGFLIVGFELWVGTWVFLGATGPIPGLICFLIGGVTVCVAYRLFRWTP